MPNFRRYYIPNALVFITCVTHQRHPWLRGEHNLAIFRETVRSVQVLHPFELLAYVVMPDHFHWIMQLPEDRPDFSRVIHSLKRNFVLNYKKTSSVEVPLKLWQDRFWDHLILDEADLERHCDYIHWNPIKHGYVTDPQGWPASSFRHWLHQGHYPSGWGVAAQPASICDLHIE